jgi:predicted enzyme related to lactoylglutathione lyase
MSMDVLFAGVRVRDLSLAADWYSRLFGRTPDIVPNEHEVMWRVADGGWLYVVKDEDENRAGNSLVAIAVPNLDSALTELAARKITFGATEVVGDAARKAATEDPDGNSLALIEVPH